MTFTNRDHPTQCYPVAARIMSGYLADDPCIYCKHRWVLHSAERGCAGCEAIAAALSERPHSTQTMTVQLSELDARRIARQIAQHIDRVTRYQ